MADFNEGIMEFLTVMVFNRPGVAGAVLQTASSLTDRVTDPFPPGIHNIINTKPLELDS